MLVGALPPGGQLLTRLAAPVPAWTPSSEGGPGATASGGEAAALAFLSSDDQFRAIPDSEITFTLADQSESATGESTPTWLFDYSAGAFVAHEPERLTIVIDDTGEAPQPLTIVIDDSGDALHPAPQLSQARDTFADDLLTWTPPTCWVSALRDFGRAATKAWFDT